MDKVDKVAAQKQRALELAVSQIEKQYGKGSIQRMGDKEIKSIPVIPTGNYELEVATERVPCQLRIGPLYDPRMERVKV